MATFAPSSLMPRMRLGIGRKPSPVFARQMLVSHSTPSMLARTGVRAQARVIGGAIFFGIVTYVQPPLPRMRRSWVLNGPRWTVAGVGLDLDLAMADQASVRAPSFLTVFQLRAVPRVPRIRSISAMVNFERPMPSGYTK